MGKNVSPYLYEIIRIMEDKKPVEQVIVYKGRTPGPTVVDYKCITERFFDRLKRENPAFRALRSVSVILLVFLLSSCSIIKKRFNKTNKITKIESLTVTKITESLDTNLIFGADSANFNTNLNDLFDGFTGEDNGIEVNVFVDKATGKASIKTKTKPKTVPVKFNRTTTIKSKNNSYIKEKTKVKTKDKTPIELPWFKIIFAGTLSLLLLLILISRKARDKLMCMLPFIGQGKKFD